MNISSKLPPAVARTLALDARVRRSVTCVLVDAMLAKKVAFWVEESRPVVSVTLDSTVSMTSGSWWTNLKGRCVP